jgi:hypothetical protein
MRRTTNDFTPLLHLPIKPTSAEVIYIKIFEGRSITYDGDSSKTRG